MLAILLLLPFYLTSTYPKSTLLNILHPLLQQLDQALTKTTPLHKTKDFRSKTRRHQQNPQQAPTNKTTPLLTKAKHKHVWPKAYRQP